MLLDQRSASRTGLAVVVIASFIAFAVTLTFGFLNDDLPEIVSNPFLADLSNLPRLFTGMPMGMISFFRPADYVIKGMLLHLSSGSPFLFHLANILFHATNSVLLLVVLRRISTSGLAAFIPALLFAVHPVHTEVVAVISNNNDAVVTCMALGMFLLYLERDARRIRWLTCGPVLAALAILTKETGFIIPLILAVLSSWEYRKFGLGALKHAFMTLWHLIFVAIVLLAYRLTIVGKLPELVQQDMLNRLMLACSNIGIYIRLLAVPVGLKVRHVPSTDPLPVISGCLLIAALMTVAMLFRRRYAVVAGAIWFLVGILPASGLAGLVPPFGIAERYAYLPSCGIMMMSAGILSAINREQVRKVVITTLLIAAIALAGLSVRRCQAWSDQISYYRAWADDSTIPAERDYVRAMVLLADGNPVAALDSIDRSIESDPANIRPYLFATAILSDLGRMEDAARYEEGVIRIAGDNPLIWSQLGHQYRLLGAYEKSMECYQRALELSGGDPRYTHMVEELRGIRGKRPAAPVLEQ